MNREQKTAIKQLCQSGALTLIEVVIDDIKAEMKDVDFDPEIHSFVYKVGKKDGGIEALNYLIDTLTKIARE